MAIDYDSLFQDLGEVVQLTNKMINAGTSVRANTAQAGADSTITLDASASATNDIYNRRSILLTGGTGAGQIRTITDYVGSSKIATVNIDWSTNPDDTSTFDVKKDWIDDLEKRFDEISAEYTSNSNDDLLDGVNTLIDDLKDTVISQSQTIASLATDRLQHKETILDELPQISGSTTIGTILLNLIRQMNDDSKNVEISTLTLGTVVEDKVNTNAGTLLVDKELDGVSPPDLSITANPEYNGLNSELAYIDTFTTECTLDSEAGITEGAEIFSLTGSKKRNTPWDWQANGSGTGSNIVPIHGTNVIANYDFEIFTVTNTPDNWDIDLGDVTTNILEETTNFYNTTSSLELLGDASTAVIQLSQTIGTSLVPKKRYLFACYVQGNASLSAGTLTIQFEDGSNVQVGSTNISMNTAALNAQTAFGLEYFYITMPAEIPDALEIVIEFSGTPSAHSIYIDWIGFGGVTYHGGVNFALVAGKDKFLKGDRFKMTTDYSTTGVFQDFFREYYKVQLPSHASPTQADTLATD